MVPCFRLSHHSFGVLCYIPSDQEERGLDFHRLQEIQQFRCGLIWSIFKCRRLLILDRTVHYIVGTATVTEPVAHTVRNFGGIHGRVAGLGIFSGISGAPGEPLMYLWGVNWGDLIHWWEHDWFVCGSISHDEGGQGEEPDQGVPGVC